jgi:hypothetical protein
MFRSASTTPKFIMAGLDPAILFVATKKRIAGSSPAMVRVGK